MPAVRRLAKIDRGSPRVTPKFLLVLNSLGAVFWRCSIEIRSAKLKASNWHYRPILPGFARIWR